MAQLSQRLQQMATSATLAMAQAARDLKAKGHDIISLSLGEPDFKTPKHIQEGAIKAIEENKWFAYPPVPGYMDLREAIANKFKTENNIDCTAAQIVVSTGAKHSLANIFLSLIDKGDEVIVYNPFWVTYSAQIKLAGGTPVYIEGAIENKFKANAAQLEAAITENTRAVIYSSPCNPSGAVFSKAELEAMADVLKKHPDVIVIADEIYEHINYVGHHSMAAIPGMADRTITVNGFSKGFAMTGWRLGYICAPLWIAKACTKIQGQVTSGANSIAQRAGLAALNGSLDAAKEMKAAYLERRTLVKGLLDAIPGLKTDMPDGAFYFFPDVSAYFGKKDGADTIKDADDLCFYLLNKAHVSVVTGSAFGSPNCIRLSYASSEEMLIEALARIKKALEKLS